MKQHQFVLPQIMRRVCNVMIILAAANIGFFTIYPSAIASEEENIFFPDECKGPGVFTVQQQKSYISSGSEQQFFLHDKPDTMLIGEKGTEFKKHKMAVILEQGRLLAMTGKKDTFDVFTNFGEVEIPSKTSAIIQKTPDGVLRIANILGKSLILTFRINRWPYTLHADKGEEICIIADDNFKPENLIPDDGVDRQSIWNETEIPGVQLTKNKFDQRMMIEHEQLLVCTEKRSEEVNDRLDKLVHYIEHYARPLRTRSSEEPEPDFGEMISLAGELY